MRGLRTACGLLACAVAWQACETGQAPIAPASDDAAMSALQLDEVHWSDWSTPVNLGSVINSASNDQHPAISRDGLSLYFVSDRPGGQGGLDIYVSQRASVHDAWGAPQNLGTTINTAGTDMAPNLTIDGHRLFFHSDRPGGCGDFDLWMSTRRDVRDDFSWGPPVNLGCVINSPYKDAGPSFTYEKGIPTMYFTSTRPGGPGDFDIYKSRLQRDGTWGAAELVPELSGPARDTRTAISRTGLEMFMSSDVTGRPDGVGSQDLWRSTRASTRDAWSAPVNLGPTVNSTAFDGAPALSFDGTTLYFFSARPGGFGAYDLYVTTRTPLYRHGKAAW